MMKRSVLIMCMLAACLLTAASAAEYQIRDLGPAKGHVFAKACAIGDDGRVVGQSGPHMVVWRPGCDAECLCVSPEERDDEIAAVNDNGQMVGKRSYAKSGEQKAMLWYADGKAVEMDILGRKVSEANGINDAGAVVGSCSDARGNIMAFLRKPHGEAVGLAVLKDGWSAAYDINKAGKIAGYSGTSAVLWEADGAVRDLGTLDGCFRSTAFGLNNSGLVVGAATDSLGKSRAFVWTQEAGMKELPSLAGCDEARAEDVNDAGVIVGWARNDKGAYRAVAWDTSGEIIDLGGLPGGVSSMACKINNRGEIAGHAKDKDGKCHAVVWE